MIPRGEVKEFLAAYLAEVDEQLQIANARLLEIESFARTGKLNPRAVRDLFRALHTIKGLSAMVGVEPAVAISHRMEAVLRVADQSGGNLALDSIDTLLQAIRAIEHRIRELADGKDVSPAPVAILEALDRMEPDANPEQAKDGPTLLLDASILSKLAPFEIELLVSGARSGRRAMRADFSPSPAKAERGFSINTVRDRVGSIGEIVKVVPVSVPATEDAPGALSFAILLLTSASDDDLAAAVGVAPAALHVLVAESSLDGSAEIAAPFFSALPDDRDEPEPSHHRLNVVRVDVDRLDDAMEHLSALIVTRSRLSRAVATLTAAGVNTREMTEIMRDNARQLRDLRASILRVRMVPVSEVFDRIPLLLRGLRRESGKQVRLRFDAGKAELDKGVAERLFPAIVHLVRNAVDHAIESPAERMRAGKSEEGTLQLTSVTQSNTRLELTISDDGRGVDRIAVARRSGREVTTDADLLDALCRSGFSTRDEATTTSGRGLGMDIVKRIVVDQLGGELSMRTELGVGTTFIVRVPLTISIVDAFTMECRAQRFVVPVSMVDEIIELDMTKIQYGPVRAHHEKKRTGIIERRGEVFPVVDLGALLKLPDPGFDPRQAMLVRRGREPVAFALDRVVGQQEAVVRPLVDQLVQISGIAGATDLGDGKPTVVLDLISLGSKMAMQNGERVA